MGACEKAVIFNSGVGSRLGGLTAERPKSMVRLLSTGQTLFERQLDILWGCGVREFVVTTGPYPDQLMGAAARLAGEGAVFTFVPNPRYSETNYIYSMHLADRFLRGSDCLLLHGDLVFDAAYAQALVDFDGGSAGSVNASLPQPEKDFKARLVGGEVAEVSTGIFDNDCVAFQAFYRLAPSAINRWLDAVAEFCERGETGVYAENAANAVFGDMHVKAFSYEGHCVEEIDTVDDLVRVSGLIAGFESE